MLENSVVYINQRREWSLVESSVSSVFFKGSENRSRLFSPQSCVTWRLGLRDPLLFGKLWNLVDLGVVIVSYRLYVFSVTYCVQFAAVYHPYEVFVLLKECYVACIIVKLLCLLVLYLDSCC